MASSLILYLLIRAKNPLICTSTPDHMFRVHPSSVHHRPKTSCHKASKAITHFHFHFFTSLNKYTLNLLGLLLFSVELQCISGKKLYFAVKRILNRSAAFFAYLLTLYLLKQSYYLYPFFITCEYGDGGWGMGGGTRACWTW